MSKELDFIKEQINASRSGQHFLNLSHIEVYTNLQKIVEDLEILEILKSHMRVDFDSYDNGDESETFEYVDFNGNGLEFSNQEEEDKVMRWLKNE